MYAKKLHLNSFKNRCAKTQPQVLYVTFLFLTINATDEHEID